MGLTKIRLSVWELHELPSGWDVVWRILSLREATLTAEALTYLDQHRPGAVAAGCRSHRSEPLTGLDGNPAELGQMRSVLGSLQLMQKDKGQPRME